MLISVFTFALGVVSMVAGASVMPIICYLMSAMIFCPAFYVKLLRVVGVLDE